MQGFLPPRLLLRENQSNTMVDSMHLYIRDIRHIPLLSAEEEKRLAIRVRRGDSKARKKLIQSNLRLVINIAKRYSHLGVSFDDLVEEGNLGLIKAASKYNHKKGYRFSTYAAWWIRQFITRAIANQANIIRIPVYMTEIVSKWKKAQERLIHKLGRRPTLHEVAKCIKLPFYKAKKIDQLISSTTTSLEAPIGEDGSSQFMDLLEDTSSRSSQEDIANIIRRENVEKLLSRMSERERQVLSLRFGLKDGITRTLGETAKSFGITRERVRQIEEAALNKLRKYAVR